MNPTTTTKHSSTQRIAITKTFLVDRSLPSLAKCISRKSSKTDEILNKFNPSSKAVQDLYKSLEQSMDISKLVSVEVDHCPFAFGCLLLDKQGKKQLAYSGDTIPCQNFLNYAKRSKVFIHEATLDDSLEIDAFKKKHSTQQQALKITRKAKPWRTILTHFTARY